MDPIIKGICQQEGLKGDDIQALRGGQVNQVFQVDQDYVIRMGRREDAFERLRSETELLKNLAGNIPVPEIVAFGQYKGQVYQIQKHLPGEKLYLVWNKLDKTAQNNIMAELAEFLKVIHTIHGSHFGAVRPDAESADRWSDWLGGRLKRTLDEIASLHLSMQPGFLKMASDYFDEHRSALDESSPVLVHGDLSFVNILVHDGKISGLLDFEYAMQAPHDYELWVIEAFCLFPNDYAEDDQETFCAADFAGFLPLLKKHYPGLFEVPRLRERMDLYHLEATLSSYLSWRKDHLDTIPPDRMAARDFYTARIANFTSRHGVRMFL